MTNKELNEEQSKIDQAYADTMESYETASMELDKQRKKARTDVERKIKRHFRGVSVTVELNAYGLKLSVYGVKLITYTSTVKHRHNERISKDLFDKIIAEYDEFYDEPIADDYAPYKACDIDGWVTIGPDGKIVGSDLSE